MTLNIKVPSYLSLLMQWTVKRMVEHYALHDLIGLRSEHCFHISCGLSTDWLVLQTEPEVSALLIPKSETGHNHKSIQSNWHSHNQFL